MTGASAAGEDADPVSPTGGLLSPTPASTPSNALGGRDEDMSILLRALAHDMLNPIATILLHLELQIVAAGEDRERLASLQVMVRNAERLQRLVGDLNAVGQLEGRIVALEVRELEVGDLLVEAAASFGVAAKAKGVNIQVEQARDLRVRGDRIRLSEVVANLVSNALKFTPSGGRITLRCWRDGDGVAFAVEDTGPGIPSEELHNIFQPLRQGHKPSGLEAGTGLGLYICRRILRAHGGTIAAQRMEPGPGAMFVVWIPSEPGKRAP